MSFINNYIIILIGLLLGTIIPDLDSRKSRYGQHWYFRPFQWIIKHRRLLHSPFFALISTAIISIFSKHFAFGFFIGCISHIFLDFLTKQGVPIFYPLYKKRLGLGIKTGGIIEDVIFVLLLLTDTFIVGFLLFYILS